MPKPGNGTALNTIERAGLEIRYLRITSGPQRGQYLHRAIAEAMLRRPLTPEEEVDHVDGDTLNNHWSNLQIISASEHAKKTRRQQVEKRREQRRARDRQATHGQDVPPF